MNAIALGMNIFLAVLLLAALAMGWRLNLRLRGMRDSQALFMKAVVDLDAATGRAHDGLAELRMATEEAIDLLGGRIVRAKEAADRLDRALNDTEMAARRPVAAVQPPIQPPAQPRAPLALRPAPERLAERAHERAPQRALEGTIERAPDRMVRETPERARAEDALNPTSLRGLLELAEGRRPTPAPPVQTRPAPQPAAAPRMRSAFDDDDLFVAGGQR